jgi:hypothetical protein
MGDEARGVGVAWSEPHSSCAYKDCAMPRDCQCAKRGYPKWDHVKCLVPAINVTADKLGWQRPYPSPDEVSALDRVIKHLQRQAEDLRCQRDAAHSRGEDEKAQILGHRAAGCEAAAALLREAE